MNNRLLSITLVFSMLLGSSVILARLVNAQPKQQAHLGVSPHTQMVPPHGLNPHVALQNQTPRVINFGYDNAGRLTQAGYDNNNIVVYSYDPSGSMNQVDVATATPTPTPTSTPTPTFTPTPTSTPAPTSTPIPGSTTTPSNTVTLTPVPGGTQTPTPSGTVTTTLTIGPDTTPTPTIVSGDTPTATATHSIPTVLDRQVYLPFITKK